MGQLFELIADHALKKSDDDDECHVCNKTNVDLYPYQGKCQLENGVIDDDIYAVCADCILTKKLSHSADSEYINTIKNYITASNLALEEQQSRTQALIEIYQKTPDIPLFMQYTDRPLCCNAITEFCGHPAGKEELYGMTEHVIYWEKQVKDKSVLYDFKKSGSPESLHDIASFKCRYCQKQYFTFQFS